MENKKITIEDVVAFIRSESTVEHRTLISSELVRSRDYDGIKVGRSLTTGQTVKFPDKHGVLITGKVTKINPKSIHVITPSGVKWRVSPTLIRPV